MSDPDETIAARQKTHGDFAYNAFLMQKFKDGFRAEPGWKKLSPVQREVFDMFALKLSRILTGDPTNADHWHDVCGYARLAELALITNPEDRAKK